MIVAVETLAGQERENLLSNAIGLHPPAWVSALDRTGQFYLAPFPFITAVCIDPMTILFSVNNREETNTEETNTEDMFEQHILRAIATTGEFVINFPTAETLAALNLPAHRAQFGQDAVAWAEYTTPSQSIRTPLLAAAQLAFECRLHQVMKMGNGPGGTSVIFGDVKVIYQQE